MKIRSVRLQNFRSHKDTLIEFDRFSFITGSNAAGKSSIAMAIEYALTGICECTDDAGRGAESLIRDGSSSAGVDLELSAPQAAVVRERDRRGSTFNVRTNNVEISGQTAKDWLTKNIAPPSILSAVLNSGRFLDLDAAAQKKLLSQVLADEGIPVPKEFEPYFGSDRATIGDLDRVYKVAYDRRTDVNRELKALGNLEAPQAIEVPSIDAVKKRLYGIRADRDAAVAQRSKATAEHQAHIRQIDGLKAKIADLAAKIPLKEELDLLKKLVAKVNDLAPAADLAYQLRAQIKIHEDQAAALIKLGAKAHCPTCLRSITKDEIAKVGLQSDDSVKALNAELKKAEAHEDAYREANEARQKYTQLSDLVVERSKLERELSALKPAGPEPDVSEFDATIAECDERIKKGEGVLSQVSMLQKQINDYNASVARQAELQDSLVSLEKVLAFTGPDGARKKATEGKLPGFIAAMNEALDHFGFTMGLELEPYRFNVSTGTNAARSVDQLSESEKFRFQISFQVALAKVTGIGLIVVDRADILGKSQRRQLIEMLLHSELQQALIFSTSEDPAPTTIPNGVRFIRLVNDQGVTKTIEQASEVAA